MASRCNLFFFLLLVVLLQSLLISSAHFSNHLLQKVSEEDEEEEETSLSQHLSSAAMGWSSSELEEMAGLVGVENLDETRRSLLWRALPYYYISYGALSANRIPCPPRSGRSYYTHDCYRAHGPVRPYTRGCSAITRCRRQAY